MCDCYAGESRYEGGKGGKGASAAWQELCSNLVYQLGLMELGRRRTVADNAVVETYSNERGAPCVTIRATEPAVQASGTGWG